MGRLGITVNELRDAKEGSIDNPDIARRLVRYAIKFNDSSVILKIKPELVRDALINHINH